MFFNEPLLNDFIAEREEYVSIWALMESGSWLLYRSFPNEYAKQLAVHLSSSNHNNRFHGCFPLNVDPNWIEGSAA